MELREYTMSLNDDVSMKPTKLYVGFQLNNHNPVDIKLQKNSIVLWLNALSNRCIQMLCCSCGGACVCLDIPSVAFAALALHLNAVCQGWRACMRYIILLLFSSTCLLIVSLSVKSLTECPSACKAGALQNLQAIAEYPVFFVDTLTFYGLSVIIFSAILCDIGILLHPACCASGSEAVRTGGATRRKRDEARAFQVGYVRFGEVDTPIERLQMKHVETLGVLKGLRYNVLDGYPVFMLPE